MFRTVGQVALGTATADNEGAAVSEPAKLVKPSVKSRAEQARAHACAGGGGGGGERRARAHAHHQQTISHSNVNPQRFTLELKKATDSERVKKFQTGGHGHGLQNTGDVRLQGVEGQDEGVLEPGGPRHRGGGRAGRARQGQRKTRCGGSAGPVPAPFTGCRSWHSCATVPAYILPALGALRLPPPTCRACAPPPPQGRRGGAARRGGGAQPHLRPERGERSSARVVRPLLARSPPPTHPLSRKHSEGASSPTRRPPARDVTAATRAPGRDAPTLKV
ncbi:unnamed protein product [Arctia plantaginis]|uniref:Uncharacterized protein n=1 Tax=Arctia plantaginis TaxID=874455 RepID=A0A8S1BFK1_ARCPL|nr:unnamed protein product [Arctia plantaginis]